MWTKFSILGYRVQLCTGMKIIVSIIVLCTNIFFVLNWRKPWAKLVLQNPTLNLPKYATELILLFIYLPKRCIWRVGT